MPPLDQEDRDDREDLDAYLPAIAAGEVMAFSRFMTGAEAPLRHSLQRFAAEVDVEAVVQETLLRIWQVAPRFTPDGQRQALLRFAHRCARNLCLTELRRRALVPSTESQDEVAALIDVSCAAPPDPLLRRALAACRAELPKKPQSALAARLESDGDVDDTTLAARLGMTRNTFLQNFTRARKLLAECLRKRGVEPRWLGAAP
jgi:RNA polymerase sigma factor (sigma-70 family)